jgi:cytochrome c6
VLQKLLRGLGLTRLALLAVVMAALVISAEPSWAAPAADGAAPAADGAELFANHCAGCHVNGGNIIRRGKNLHLAALERNGIDAPERIAVIAAAGQGQMSGYAAVLGEGGAEAVAGYVWQQAQLDWPKA